MFDLSLKVRVSLLLEPLIAALLKSLLKRVLLWGVYYIGSCSFVEGSIQDVSREVTTR